MVGSILARDDGRYYSRATGGFLVNRGLEADRVIPTTSASCFHLSCNLGTWNGRLAGSG